MNIQDPFVLNHNITLNVNDKLASKISQELKIAEAKSKTWFDVKFAETKSITDILNDIIPEGLNLDVVNKTVDASGLILGKYQFLVPMKTQNMTPLKLRELEEEGDIYLGWCKRMVKFIHGLIERVLMFDCEVRTTNLPKEFHKKSRDYDHSKKTKPATTGVKRGPDSTDEATTAKKSKTEENKDTDAKPSTSSENTQEQKNSESQAGARKEDPEVPMETSGAEGKVPEGPIDPFDAVIDFSKNDIYLDMDVLVFLRVWAERKKIGNKLKERGFQESIELEQTISETLFYDYLKPSRNPILEFRLIFRSDVKPGMASSLLVEAITKPHMREYDAVFHFVKKFVLKAVEKWF